MGFANSINLATPAALDGIVEADQKWTGRGKGLHQQTEQNPTRLPRRPADPVEQSMIVLKTGVVRPAQDTKNAGYRALAGSQNRTHRQELGSVPDRVAKERGKCENDGGKTGR
jgi:hypothetical protein